MTDVNAAQNDQNIDQKELNFRALEAKYQRQLEQERAIRLETEKRLQELSQSKLHEDDDDDEPYVDKKRLKREQERFGNQIKQETQSEIQKAVQHALKEKEKQDWIRNNPDFFDTLNHADKLAIEHPDLADTILKLPDTFERQQLVYQNIKKLGLHKDRPKEPSIQEKIDSNRRSPYYQQGGIGSPAYNSVSDFSASGQKNAYDKMQELKSRLRL
jgi:hypothetical protein